MKNLLVLVFYSLMYALTAQESVTLRGKVVELQENKTVGVPGVVVSVSGESYDVTGQDGMFKLFAPKGLEFVTITVKGSSSSVISPFEGKVNIPPIYDTIVVKLCAEKNVKLLKKVEDLNARIRSMQKSQKLNARQIEHLHKTMLDTISYFQEKIERYQYQLALSNTKQKELEEKITELEKTNALLEEKLFKALGEKYARQQMAFDSISSGINQYISRLKDLQLILPTDALACVNKAQNACTRFYNYIEKYNSARNYINENKEQQVHAAQYHWSDHQVATTLAALQDYILHTIHEPLMFEKMNQSVINPIKQRSQGKKSQKEVKKEIEMAAQSIANELSPLIKELDLKKTKLYHLFLNSVQ